jgi:hypothetical protein
LFSEKEHSKVELLKELTNMSAVRVVTTFLWDGVTLKMDHELHNQPLSKQKDSEIFPVLLDDDEEGESLARQLLLLKTLQHKLSIVQKVRELKAATAQFRANQTAAYTTAINHLSVQTNGQLIMLLTGAENTGKTFLSETLCKYIHLTHRKSEDQIVWLDKMDRTKNKSLQIFNTMMATWSKVDMDYFVNIFGKSFLVVLENIQMISLEEIERLNVILGKVTGKTNLPFGGIHILLVGDLYEPLYLLPQQRTHILKYGLLTTKKRAISGQSLLLKCLTHCIDLSLPIATEGTSTLTFGEILERERYF